MGERIAELRRKCGLSQAALAKKLGLSTSAIAMYEQGRREPSVAILIALTEVLGVTMDYLLTGQIRPKPVPASREGDNSIKHSNLAAAILCTAWYIGGNDDC